MNFVVRSKLSEDHYICSGGSYGPLEEAIVYDVVEAADESCDPAFEMIVMVTLDENGKLVEV